MEEKEYSIENKMKQNKFKKEKQTTKTEKSLAAKRFSVGKKKLIYNCQHSLLNDIKHRDINNQD